MPTAEQLKEAERRVNQLITDALPITVHTETYDDATKPDSLPADYVGGGTIRRVEIQKLDMNACCGTHVQHTGHLQTIKLLHTEKSRGGNTRLFFLVGQRVTESFDAALQVSRQLNNLLSCPQEAFVENVTRLQQSNRLNQKMAKRFMAELAPYIASDIVQRLAQQNVVFVYREDGDMDLLQLIYFVLKDQIKPNTAVVLAAGEKNAGGPLMIVADADHTVQTVAKVVKEAMDIKGGGKGRWQGKAKSWKGIEVLQKQLDQLTIAA